MEQTCHRCGTTLQGPDPFCPHCGAPQLRYEAPDELVPSASGSLPQQLSGRNPNVVSWRDAILAAAFIAIPAGVLSSLIGLEAIWVLLGSAVTISLYRRRTQAQPSSAMSWRIGTLFGLFAAVIAAAAHGLALLVQRYGLHQGAVIDQNYRDAIDASGKVYAGLFANSGPDMAAVLAQNQRFWLTPDGTAAMALANSIGVAVIILLFAAAGGALGARLTARTAQHGAH